METIKDLLEKLEYVVFQHTRRARDKVHIFWKIWVIDLGIQIAMRNGHLLEWDLIKM